MASRSEFQLTHGCRSGKHFEINLGKIDNKVALQLVFIDKHGRRTPITNDTFGKQLTLRFAKKFQTESNKFVDVLHLSYRKENQLDDTTFTPVEIDDGFCRKLKEAIPHLKNVQKLTNLLPAPQNYRNDTASNDTESDSPEPESAGPKNTFDEVCHEQFYNQEEGKEHDQSPTTVKETISCGETLPLDPEASLNSGTNETSDNGEPTSTLPAKPADQSESDSDSSTGSIDMPTAQLRHGLSLQRKANAMSNYAADTVEETSTVETPVEDRKPAPKARNRRFRGLPPQRDDKVIAQFMEELAEQSPARDEDNCGGKVGKITARLEDFFRRRKLAANNPEEHNFMLIGILLFILVVVLLFKRFTQHHVKNGDEDNNDAQEAEVDNNIV